MAQSAVAAVSASVPSSSSPRNSPQPPLTATSQHVFPNYDSVRVFLDSHAHARGFELRYHTQGSAFTAAHSGKAVCWCSRPAAEQSSQQSVEQAETGVASRKRRRAAVTSDGVQVHCGCHWFVNFNKRSESARSVYALTGRNLAHNGDQYTQHDERAVTETAPAAMDDASALQQRLFDAVEAGVKAVLSSRHQYASVAADERVIRRAVQLDKKRDGRFVCYAAKQCAAAISRQRQQQNSRQQQQQHSEHKDDHATAAASDALAVVSSEEMAESMATAIRAQVALDEQLAAVAEVDSTDGFINLALHIAPTQPLATLSPPAPASWRVSSCRSSS